MNAGEPCTVLFGEVKKKKEKKKGLVSLWLFLIAFPPVAFVCFPHCG
jgi:hypothetical protein